MYPNYMHVFSASALLRCPSVDTYSGVYSLHRYLGMWLVIFFLFALTKLTALMHVTQVSLLGKTLLYRLPFWAATHISGELSYSY